MTKNVVMILLFLLFTSFLYSQTVSILYFNDAHEMTPVIDEYGERGGFARLKTVIDSVKKENPEAIVVFGGDCAGGTLFGALYHGHPQIEAFNRIPVDIASFGQHDFDFGVDNNKQLIEESTFQWITSNLIEEDGSTYADLSKYAIIECSVLRIGFIGLTDAMDTTRKTKGVLQVDLIEAAGDELLLLENENPDFIIAITQTNLEKNKQILDKFSEIDAILTEERSEIVTEVSWVGNRPIISPCGNIGSIARLDIAKEGNDSISYVTAYPIDATVVPDPGMLKLEKKYQNELNKKLSMELTHLKSPLVAGITDDHASRWKETNIGDLLTDSFREYYQADIAVLNGGGIRADADSGAFTLKDAQAIIPFGNRICMIEITGKEFRAMLEHGVSEVEDKAGKFLQISGGSYTYDPGKEQGGRIVEVKVHGVPISENKKYSLTLPDYILNGGDGFNVKDYEVIVSPKDAPKDIDIFVEYCTKKRKINAKLERRIKVIDSEK